MATTGRERRRLTSLSGPQLVMRAVWIEWLNMAVSEDWMSAGVFAV
jgi:hypothetical protein